MKQIMKLTVAMLLALLPAWGSLAQNTVQPKIMVIPYVKQGEDLRSVLENDVNKRIAITKIKEAFDNRGFTTVDFAAKLKATTTNAAMTSDNQTDLKTMIVQQSGADIYVEAEVDVQLSSSGNSVKIIVTGYECSTGNSLSNKVGESGRFYTDDIGKLASKAIESIAEDFLNTMQMKFTDIVANGKSVMVVFGFADDSQLLMSSEVGSQGLQLSDEIEMWMEEHAYKNNYHIQGTTDRQMMFDDVRIPLKDPNTGNNYNSNKFALDIFKFMRSLGIQIQRDIKGSTIYITIK